MIDIRLIRENPEHIRERLATRNYDAPIEEILRLDEQRRASLGEVESLKNQRNEGSKLVGRTKDAEERNRYIAEMKEIGDRISALDDVVRETESQLNDILLALPNIPDPDVPIGPDASFNVEARSGGTKRAFDFQPKPHWELGESLGIIDFERGIKLAGTRGYVLRGDGSRLQRALISWMLDVHTQRHGYSEIDPPYLVLGEMLVGTGNLPKFGDVLFRDIEEDKWMIPTAEVPVTNLYRDEILDESQLPIYHVAATKCFRREAISAGRDVRGIKRVYEFEKVELVKFVHPDTASDEHQRLIEESLYIVDQLGLPWHLLSLATGDSSASSAHTYDVETWAPGSDEWLEISSCSVFRDYQARRANLRFRPDGGGRPQFLATLNGSALALPRTIIAIIENYQNADGTVTIPDVLQPYLGGQTLIEPNLAIGPSKANW
jgi:seryl-tRNA synthetase